MTIALPPINPVGFGALVVLGGVLLWAIRRPKPDEAPKPKPEPTATVEVVKGYPAPTELFDVRTCAACRKTTWVPKGRPAVAQVLCPECFAALRASVAPTAPSAPAEAKAPTTVPARRLTWRERRLKATALAEAFRQAAAEHRRKMDSQRRDAQRVLVEADREVIARRFEAWDQRESQAIHDEMIDDLRGFYPDVTDEQLERIAASLAKAPVPTVRGGDR